MEVVGVVKDVLPALSDAKQRGAVYILLAQQQQEAANFVMARGNATTARLNREMQTAVGQASTDAAVVRGTSLDELVNAALYPQRAATTLVAVSGLVALLLATLGLYGLIAYSAAQRKGEVAVRRVLGASDRDVMTLVLKDAVKIAVLGTGLGLPLAYGTTRIASSLVPGIPRLSSLGLMVTPLCLALVILAACLVPARRAMRVDPMETLRSL
jgi:ABC-type antimicrobial peptide transport system permease subunit